MGHAEADIAMTELFGGFPAAFYGAYRESGMLRADYTERRGLYNLYHLLNHLMQNLRISRFLLLLLKEIFLLYQTEGR